MPKFNVTYEIWEEAAVEAGETDDKGFELEGGTLREAVEAARATRTNEVDGVESVEPSDSLFEHARWITVNNGREFATGARESRSLHIPDGVTGASRWRIGRLLGLDLPVPDREFGRSDPRT
jgi:hypothetical protein